MRSASAPQAVQGPAEEKTGMPSLYFRMGMNSAGRRWRPRGGDGTTDNQLPECGRPREENLAISLVFPSSAIKLERKKLVFVFLCCFLLNYFLFAFVSQEGRFHLLIRLPCSCFDRERVHSLYAIVYRGLEGQGI